ncbi:MAG: hypothetical protein RR206_04705 [Bacteroidaceae bacterium]
MTRGRVASIKAKKRLATPLDCFGQSPRKDERQKQTGDTAG